MEGPGRARARSAMVALRGRDGRDHLERERLGVGYDAGIPERDAVEHRRVAHFHEVKSPARVAKLPPAHLLVDCGDCEDLLRLTDVDARRLLAVRGGREALLDGAA